MIIVEERIIKELNLIPLSSEGGYNLDFKDYENAIRVKLIESHPQFTGKITRLTR